MSSSSTATALTTEKLLEALQEYSNTETKPSRRSQITISIRKYGNEQIEQTFFTLSHTEEQKYRSVLKRFLNS